ncbi:MAG: UDP-4-amino-4-deoxy-L-arabinose aminotransferase [Planctomycetes bacterium]|nr:UDP-4-amino-4-deoxy-L-arabinose aminotransferase [Planctomycetota bacterium]
MRSSFLPFSQPDITDADIEAVVRVMRSRWLTTGRECQAFEEAFAARVGCPGAVALASATAGLHLLLTALGIGPGDEVITPSLTWVSTPNLIELAGATPVWADVDRDTLLLSADRVEPLLTDRTRAIIPVHFAGAPVDLDPLRRLAAERGVVLIEDAAHAIGTRYRGRPVGQTGTSIFSFHPIKNITSGEGGMVCSDDLELLARIRRLKFHGLGADAFDRETGGRKPQAEVLEPGYKYNLTDMAAALGRSQLARLDGLNAIRTRLAAFYDRAFADRPEIRPLARPAWLHTHAWSLYPVRLDHPGLSRAEFMARLARRNIGTGIHFMAAHTHAHYRGRWPAALPDSEWNSERILSLPLFPGMTEEDAADVVAAVTAALRGE